MSVIRRTRGGQEYLYFQYYDNGKKVEKYIGPAKNNRTWEQWDHVRTEYVRELSDRLKRRMSELDTSVAIILGLDRRRILEAVKPQVGAIAELTSLPMPRAPSVSGAPRKKKSKGKRSRR